MFRAKKKKNSRLAAVALALAVMTAALPHRGAAQDTAQPAAGDSTEARLDSLPVDSMVTPPSACDTAVADTAVPESVSLEPTLYLPSHDTILMAAYRHRNDENKHRRSPTLTLFKSVVFPGWGQFSNGKYVKAGLVFAVESYFIYKAVYYGGKASDWREKWKSAPQDQKYLYFNKYADYRDTRNSFLWYTGLTVFLSMFDAYVDAHLANFPKDIPTSDKISLDFKPGRESRLVLSYKF
jgi:hypothetical protein